MQASERPVHITLEKFENGALLLPLGLPSKLIRLQNGAFRKRFSDRTNLKLPAFRFIVDGSKTEFFEKRAITIIR